MSLHPVCLDLLARGCCSLLRWRTLDGKQMWEENVNFYLGHVSFDMPEINPNEDVKEAVYI